ncbi:MAG: ParB/RepB/Spo0J family partition protein [Candidatus Odyssella sp.]|nr:ParB/RepB/Spo0J family partition protein [Candidatus Odyssella sp.]
MNTPTERILYGEARPDGSIPYWRMATLWTAAAGKPAVELPIETLGVLDAVVWFGGPKDVQPTVRKVAERARDIFAADLAFPIIVTKSGEVLDGAHRIARAYLAGVAALPAVVIDGYPPPDGFVEPAG